MALVGGTGVGKSTLLNALARGRVSPASARRPTTDRPLAWVPAAAARQKGGLARLLDRLQVGTVVEHDADDLEDIVVLDLPDIDSLELGHRSAVEAVLPKVDVVAWITDPEKYADAVFHDSFLRHWMSRLDRQIIVLNKIDRLQPDAVRSVSADLRTVLERELPALARRPPEVIATSATDGTTDGVAPLRRWLAEAAGAKAVVSSRIVAAASAAVADLAGLAGVLAHAEAPTSPRIISNAERERAIRAATDEVLRLVDLPGAERQAVAATRSQARRRGTGPIGLVTTAVYRASGRHHSSANPAGYLRDWRRRGGLTRAAEVVRGTVTSALPSVPAALRPQFMAAGTTADLEQRIGASLDRVISAQPSLEPPSSHLWSILGLLQTANTVLLVFAAAWTVIWIIARPEVASYDMPIVGPMPAPLVLLLIGVVAGYVLARALALHAGWVGRRWARRLSARIRSAIGETVANDAFPGIDAIETARSDLAAAWRRVVLLRS